MYVYDLQEDNNGEIKYIVKRAYYNRVGSIITDKPIQFSKEYPRKAIQEIIFLEQIPIQDSCEEKEEEGVFIW